VITNANDIYIAKTETVGKIVHTHRQAVIFAVLFEVTSYALSSYLLVASPNPLRSQTISVDLSSADSVCV